MVKNTTKLNLGCGDMILSDFINVDGYCELADVKSDVKKLPFPDDFSDYIYTSHVIEHFDFKEAFEVLKEWKRVLKPGAILHIETPDLLRSCEQFIKSNSQERIGLYAHFFSEAWINPGMIHKFMYTEEQMKWTLETVGFKEIKFVLATRYIGKEHINLGVECTK